MASVEFSSGAQNVMVAFGDRYLRFHDHRYETSDAEEIAFLSALCAARPGSYKMVEGGFICGVCFKVCKTQFALDGHMRSHGGSSAAVQ